ncbi:MAG: hypothetical protein J5599_07805 [Spirochaetales bacterium]|nr:hypothetical protein [Spirochaetales bacterium]
MKAQNITKTLIINMLQTLKTNLEHILENTEPKNADFKLRCKRYRGKTHLYLTDATGKETYLSLSNAKEIKKHAQTRYIGEVHQAAKREISQIDRCLGALSNNNGISDINDVYDNLPEILKPYVIPLSLADDDYAAKWQESNVVVKRKRIHQEDDYHKLKTMRGDYVGSKSELIIADRLYSTGVPYHYEVAFIPEARNGLSTPVFDEYGRIVGYESLEFDPFSRDTLHPDFYVLNKRTRKAYFWEHLGKTNDPKYCVDNLNRLLRILDAGYTIGEEIIVTHEDQYHPLRTEMIDEVIEKYLK